MEPERLFVMLDPATDDVLSLCEGPTADGRCPVADTPPYICAGLHLLGTRGAPDQRVSVRVTEMVPGRCPLARLEAAS